MNIMVSISTITIIIIINNSMSITSGREEDKRAQRSATSDDG